MKTLNINELKQQVAEAHKKLIGKVSEEDLENALKNIREDLHN
jgi:hypothetical protein